LTSQKNKNLSNLFEEIRTKCENNENNHINKQKEMINEIQILKEKLKVYSDRNNLMQKEIEELKKNKINMNKNINNNLSYTLKEEQINNNINMFQLKLNNIIDKYSYKKKNINDFLNNNNINNDIGNSNININPINKINNLNLVNKLFNIFNLETIPNLNKNDFIFKETNNNKVNENIIEDNYDKIFENNPQLKYFINVLCDKLKEEKDYNEKLEENTIQIFNNDIKTIDRLEKKLKLYECSQKTNLKVKDKLNKIVEFTNNDYNDVENSNKSSS
jgi:hypothetical protein